MASELGDDGEDPGATEAKNRRDRIASRREAYLRVASPLPHSLGRSGADLRSAGSVASFSTAAAATANAAVGRASGYGVGSYNGSTAQSLRQQQSQDLDGLFDDSVPLDDLYPSEGWQGGRPSAGTFGTGGRAYRQVTLPAGPLGTVALQPVEFRGFTSVSQNIPLGAALGRGPASGLPSPVPFRGMSTPVGGLGASSSAFSTPRQSAPGGGQRSVAFQKDPTASSIISGRGEAAGGAAALSLRVGGGSTLQARPGQPPRGSGVAGGGFPSTPAASVTPAVASSRASGGGGSILDRAAYLSASRGSILANALAGRQSLGGGGAGGSSLSRRT